MTAIRPYREADRDEVVDLWRRAFPDDPPRNEPELVIRRKLEVQRDLFLVAEEVERIVGAVLAGYDGFRGWIYHLAVQPERRRRGIGRALVAEAESRLRALGCPKVNLQVRASNAGVIAFYECLGYRREDHASFGREL